MKVLHVGKYYYPYRGGMETYLYHLCMASAGSVDVEVVVANTGRRTVHETVEGIPVTRVGRIATVRSTGICPSFIRHVSAIPADIVHIHSPNPMAELSVLASRSRAKIIITYQSDIIRQRALLKVYAPVLRRLLARADRILVHTERYARSSPFLRPHLHKIRYVPLGIDVAAYRKTPAVERLVQDIIARYGERIVLFIGRLVYYKGVAYLIDAMKDVPANLIIIGGGVLKRRLARRVRESGITEKAHFLQDVSEEEKTAFLHAAAVLCLPSVERSEAFGIVQLEAMACGTPVVNTAIEGSGAPSVSVHNETGLTVPPRDAAALSRALREILTNQPLAAAMSRRCIDRVQTCFTREKTTEMVLDIYRELVERTGTAPGCSL